MAKNVKINGIVYSEVQDVKMPLADNTSEMALFVDTSDATATESNILSGKSAYVNGYKVNGKLTTPSLSVTDGVLTIA